MPFIQISGATPSVYRSIPQQEKLLLVSPKQEAIFTHLNNISYQRFPELIKDILVLVEGHKLVDLTDGPGDEKQDILTLTSQGKRCLTQCKHSKNHKTKYSGDNLDLLFSASVRKDCDLAIFATNGDLSTQAKRYISDSEYERKRTLTNETLSIDYWSGYRIWQKLQTNPILLNKWFGNLGQVHGLRNFSFEITLFKLPYHNIGPDIYEQLLAKFLTLGKIEPTERKLVYKGSLSNKVSFTISRSHQFQSNFDINYLSTEDDKRYVNKPMDSLALAVTITSDNAFTPRNIRSKILSYLLDDHLPPIPSDSWWHIVCSRVISFVFVHDIQKSKPISLDSSETFIKSGSLKVTEEKLFCKLKKEYTQIKHHLDEAAIPPPSKFQVMQYFTQRREPFDKLNHSGVQFTQYSFLNSCNAKATGRTNIFTQREILNILPSHWLSFAEDNMLVWFIPENEDITLIESVEKNIDSIGFQVFPLNNKVKATAIANLKMQSPDFIVHSSPEMLRFPINLSKRKFIISNSFSFNHQAGFDLIENLISFKFSYESQFGYTDKLNRKKYSYRDLTDMLFQPHERRGEKMLDINIWENPIKVVMQFNKCPIKPSNEVVKEFVNEFKYIESFIKKLFDSMAIKKSLENICPNTI